MLRRVFINGNAQEHLMRGHSSAKSCLLLVLARDSYSNSIPREGILTKDNPFKKFQASTMKLTFFATKTVKFQSSFK